MLAKCKLLLLSQVLCKALSWELQAVSLRPRVTILESLIKALVQQPEAVEAS